MNMDSQWKTVERWFERVCELTSEERVALFDLEDVEQAVRQEVEELCAAEATAGNGLQPSAGYRRALGGGFAPTEDPSGSLVGRYRLDSLIGRGGMGTVWLAHRDDEAFDQRVAVKLVKRGLDTEETLRRFRYERQVLASLEHPGIARLIDGGVTDQGLPYMVLEYVEGVPLDRWCRENNLGTKERLQLFLSICEAVQFAHQNLVVHRDLKPSNILVGADGKPRLLDFGIAKVLDPAIQGLTRAFPGSGRLLTPEYASPEQVLGKPVSTSTDVYSLGVVLYELLTGALPCQPRGTGATEIERAICQEQPKRPSTLIEDTQPQLRRDLRGDLDTILMKALAKSSDRRYSSVEQFSQDIERHLAGLPVLARPDSLGYRTAKLVRRHRIPFLALTAVFLTLLTSLGMILGSLQEARLARNTADARFRQVQSLSKEILFDLHDSIARIPGATDARHRLIATGLRYLDALALEAGEDPQLLLDLAQGYERLADVQGKPTAASLGETRKAYASYAKALGFLERLQEQDPSDESLRLASARIVDQAGTLELRLGRSTDALASFESSTEVLRELGLPADLTTGLYHQVEALAQLGRTQAALSLGLKCLEVARQDVADDPRNVRGRRNLRIVLFKLADLHSLTHDLELAEREALEAVELAEGLHAGAREDIALERDLALSLAMLARIRIADGRADTVESEVSRQLAILERLHGLDGANLHAKRDLALAYERLGALSVAKGQAQRALDSFSRCVELNTAVVQADPDVGEWRRMLALSHEKAAGVQLELGQLAEARQSCQSMTDLLEPLVNADKADAASARLLAMAFFRLAQLDLEAADYDSAGAQFEASAAQFKTLSQLDPADAWTRRMAMVAVYFEGWVHREQGFNADLDVEDRRVHLKAACQVFERSLDLSAELEELGMLQPGDREEAQAVREKIEACRALLVQIGD